MSESARDGTNSDVITILTTDHQEMLELLAQIGGTTDAEQRRDLADSAIAEVMRHAVAEEMFVYPEMEKHIPNGTEDVEHDKKEHDEIVQTMKQMEDVDTTEPKFMSLVRELEGQLRHHAHDEESEQFPKLRAHLSEDKLVEMGEKVQTAKKLAPTRRIPLLHIPNCSTRPSGRVSA